MTDPKPHTLRVRQIFPAAVSSFWRALPQFLTYQIWTKLLFSVILLPGFWLLARFLMVTNGMFVITNSTLAEFLLQKEGLLLAAVGLLLIFLGIIVELFGFITLSARTLHNKPEASYRSLVAANLRRIPKLLGFGGLLLVLYLLVLVPLSGAGVGLSFISLRIPNFIGQAIESNPVYLWSYAALVIATLVISIRWVFTLHFIVICQMRPWAAMRASADLYRKNRRSFLKSVAVMGVLLLLFVSILLVGWLVLTYSLIDTLDFSKPSARGLLVGLFFLQSVGGFLGTVLYVPFVEHVLTLLFYKFMEKDSRYADLQSLVPRLPEKKKFTILDRLLRKRGRFVLVTLLIIAGIAAVSQGFLLEYFTEPYGTQTIAHRAGGFAKPENSLTGLFYAIENGADYTEVDVQRTKDGVYILHHDNTFRRTLGVRRRAQELTLQQIQSHTLSASKETVPELSAFLDAAKGRIRVMLELKGSTADEKMAEDVIALVREKGMEGDIVITSLDYRMIEWIEAKHPDILTGFIYFLTFGDVENLEGDYLILEEGLATADRIAEIRDAGKKSVVWTVNQPEAMQAYFTREVDAIITDEVRLLEEQRTLRDGMTMRDRIRDVFETGLFP